MLFGVQKTLNMFGNVFGSVWPVFGSMGVFGSCSVRCSCSCSCSCLCSVFVFMFVVQFYENLQTLLMGNVRHFRRVCKKRRPFFLKMCVVREYLLNLYFCVELL